MTHGNVVWQQIDNIATLEARIQSLVEQPPQKPNFGFCFIKCNVTENDTHVKQLLLLPPRIDTSDIQIKKANQYVNVNVILIDSVSHSHFIRSMPRSIEALKKIQREQAGYMFSYNLVQGVSSSTYENEKLLFEGEIYDNLLEMSQDTEGISLQVLLDRYNNGGYEIMWLEDACWKDKIGLSKLTGILEYKNDKRWKMLQEALRRTGIDRLDLSLASCEILRANGYKYQYYPEPICYNGKPHHYYMLSYLFELQEYLQSAGKPFCHFTITDIGHEGTGRRIQTLDDDLANYILSIPTLKNTLTILLSDHGNSYGDIFKRTGEALIEIYHPMLTIIASQNMPKIIGEDKMKALAVNQGRLVSMLDLHYTLQTLAPEGSIGFRTAHAQYDINPMGLLSPIKVNRTCDSVPRIEPNTCICEGFDTHVANDTRQTSVAEFALGLMNNLIQKQFRIMYPDAETGFGACQRLVGKWFSNVREMYQSVRKYMSMFFVLNYACS